MPLKRDPKWAADSRGASTPGRWAKLLRQGEPDAVRVVRERIRKILGFRGLRIPVHESEDLEQEIMTEVWQAVNRDSFDFTAGFWGFVETVTARRCIDWMRRRREHVPLIEGLRDRRQSPTERMIDDERSTLAETVMRDLDPACREILLLRFRHGMQYGEISKRLGKSEGALRVQMHRCVRRARDLLQRGGDDWRPDVRKDGSDDPS